MTVAELISKLDGVEDKSIQVWVYNEQDASYEGITNVSVNNYNGTKVLDISTNVLAGEEMPEIEEE